MPLSPVHSALLPPPVRVATDAAWPVAVQGEPRRGDTEPLRHPAPTTGAEPAAQERRERTEREMLGRLRVALAEPESRHPENLVRRGAYRELARGPADLLEQRISRMLGDSGGVSLRRLDVRA